MHPAIQLISAATLFTLSFATQSAPIYNVNNGQLAGISNLEVGGLLYNVIIGDGSYTGIFGTTSDFADSTSAENAANAIVAALRSASALPTGSNSDPALVNGCNGALGECAIFIPFGVPYSRFDGINIDLWDSYLYLGHVGVGWETGTTTILTDLSTSSGSSSGWSTYAKFNLVTSIPEPSSIVLLATGMVGLWSRRFKSKTINSA